MVAAITWLCSDAAKMRRAYDVYGTDAVLRADVCARIEARLAPEEVRRLDASVLADRVVWEALETAPLARPGRKPGPRLVVVSHADALRDWSGLERFLGSRAAFSETTLLLVSDRAEQGRWTRAETRGPTLPGSRGGWTRELFVWEQLMRDHSGSIAIDCHPPSAESVIASPRSPAAPSPVARWLSLRLPVSQRQAEYLWSRVGASSALARDAVEALRLAGVADATRMSYAEFVEVVDALAAPRGAEDVAELILFGRRDEALASVAASPLESAEWHRLLSYLSGRLDWLGPLHDALSTKEEIASVRDALGIHQKWILTYANRHVPSANIAKHFDRARVIRNRRLLAECSAALSSRPGVPPGFGEVLICSW